MMMNEWRRPGRRAGLWFALTCSAITLAACERVVEVDVTEGPVRLVVEARIEARSEASGNLAEGRQAIHLTTTAPYFDNASPPPAREAEVQVADDLGRTVRFAESRTPGVYMTDSLVAVPGRTYTLRIRWRGDVYEAQDHLETVAAIDSLYFVARARRDPATDGVRATLDLRDPPQVRNYYLWDQWVDGVRQVTPDTAFRLRVVASDELYDGRRVRGLQPFDGVAVRSGQEVRVRQYSISETIWRYYEALNQQTDGDGSPFSVPPSSVRGNVANLTRPTARALGYFSATAVSERVRRVP